MTDWPLVSAFFATAPSARFALVSLVARTGSSYRPVGARLLVREDGAHRGSLSGGCLEDEAARAALAVLAGDRTRIHEIDTRPHFGCPGRLTLRIEALAPGWLDAIARELVARRPFEVLTPLGNEGGVRLRTQGEPGFGSDAAGVVRESVLPTPRLVVVSGTSDADDLASLAAVLHWDVRRVLPAGDRGSAEDAARGIVCAPEALASRFRPDERTAVVVMTHHLARDLAFLRAALAAPYPYVGLLGSKRRRSELLSTLGEEGLLADDTIPQRLHAPVGLDLGASDPASVALSIVAEVQAYFRGRDGGPLGASDTP